MPRAAVVRDRALARRRHAMAGAAPRRASRRVLRRLLLGAHAAHVRSRDGQRRLDARGRRGHGHRKKRDVGPQAERAPRHCADRMGCADRARPYLVVAGVSEAAPARPRRILPVIVFSQFAGTSLWFAGNAVLGELQQRWNLGADALGHVTSAVQLGFVLGTLTFAFFAIADRYSPRKVFLLCSLLGAGANAGA